MRRALFVSAAVLLAPAALAAGQDPVAGQITVLGTGSARVAAPEDPTETEIAQAVAEARVRATPAAIDRAREVATAAASAAGLPLGAIVGLAEQRESLAPAGRFGPGRYCGSVRPLRTVTKDGRTTTVRGKARRVCVIPKSVTVVVAVAFRTTPPA